MWKDGARPAVLAQVFQLKDGQWIHEVQSLAEERRLDTEGLRSENSELRGERDRVLSERDQLQLLVAAQSRIDPAAGLAFGSIAWRHHVELVTPR